MAHPTEKVVGFILRRRVYIILATLFLTTVAGYFLTKIKVNNDPTSSLPSDLKESIEYENLKKVFASPRTVLFIAEFDSMAFDAKIDSMASWARQFDGIDGIDNVVHIGSVQIPVTGGLFGLSSDYLVSRKKKLSNDEIRERIADTRALTGMLISEDESTLSMIMDLDETRNQVETIARVDSVYTDIARTAPGRVYITGAPMYAFFIDRAMKRDFSVLMPVCFGLVFILLFAVFRRLLHVVSSLVIISIALIWTFGIMGMTSMQFSVVTSIIPVILFPIGVATAIHVFRTHARVFASCNGNNVAAITVTFRELMNPIFLSAITTFAGFASFSMSRVLWTRTFGIFTSIGVVFALLLSILLLPIVLYYDSRPPREARQMARRFAAGPHVWNAYRRFIMHPAMWIVFIACIVTVGIIGLTRVHVEGNPIAMFPRSSELRRSDEVIERHLGGTRFLFVLLESDSGMYSVEQWRQVQEIIDYAQSDTMVGGSMSLLPLINKISMALSDTVISEPALAMLLKSKGLLGKKFDSYLRGWVSPDRKSVKIALVCRNLTGTRFIHFSRSLHDYINAHYPHFTSLVAGPPVLNDAMTYVLVETQISSLSFTFLFVFIILCILFRSVQIGTFAIIPIIFSTVTVYALMGFFGVDINVITVIIVNTCVGIGIDYSIHFVAGYLWNRGRFDDRTAALMETARIKGSVIIFNTVIVGLGFLVLSFSHFPPIRDFGMFVFVSMMTSSTFALIFLPVFFRLSGTRRRRKAAAHSKE